jgi:hypothetical protein
MSTVLPPLDELLALLPPLELPLLLQPAAAKAIAARAAIAVVRLIIFVSLCLMWGRPAAVKRADRPTVCCNREQLRLVRH